MPEHRSRHSTPFALYDPGPTAQGNWWLPAPPGAPGEPDRATDAPTEPRHVAAWGAAEAEHAAALARAAEAAAARGERLRHGTDGLRMRLARSEAAELSWQLGDRVREDRLALYLAGVIGGGGDDARALAGAGWAVRRLTGGPAPEPRSVMEFLRRSAGGAVAAERAGQRADDLLGRPDGAEVAALADRWAGVLAEAEALHPITRGALAFAAWWALGLAEATAPIEGAVVAARLGAVGSRGAGFLPLAGAGGAALRQGGAAADRLVGWYGAVEGSALGGLMVADRLDAWRDRAAAAMRDLTGRTPPRLVAALAAWPLASAPMLAAETGASRAAVTRNMARLDDLGLVREVTGQDRFRFWTATL